MNALERVIAWFSPGWAARRAVQRNVLQLAGHRNARPGRLGRSPGGQGGADFHLETTYDRRDLVDRARQLQRDNALADGLLSRSTENVVGRGIKPQASTKDPAWNEAAEKLFTEWAQQQADVRGMATFEELQRLVFRAYLRDGDVGIAKLTDGSQAVYLSDQISSPVGRESDPRMRDGVELDRRGRPVRFWVASGADDPRFPNRRQALQREAIAAKDFMFLTRRMDTDQTRGLPVFAQNEWLFEQIDGLVEAITVAARMAACYGLVIETPYGPGDSIYQTQTGADGRSYRIENFEPGGIKYLEVGEKMAQLAPQQPQQDAPDFLAFLCRLAGLQLGLPLELILLDFSRTNLSSARASLLQAYRAFRILQQYLVDHWLRPTWEWLVRRWIAAGKLPARADAFACDWVPDGWSWIDPLVELQAHGLAIDLGVETLEEITRSMGKDFVRLLDKRKEEIKKQKAAGMPEVRSNLTRDPTLPGQELVGKKPTKEAA